MPARRGKKSCYICRELKRKLREVPYSGTVSVTVCDSCHDRHFRPEGDRDAEAQIEVHDSGSDEGQSDQ